jgi:hypothetical protein
MFFPLRERPRFYRFSGVVANTFLRTRNSLISKALSMRREGWVTHIARARPPKVIPEEAHRKVY